VPQPAAYRSQHKRSLCEAKIWVSAVRHKPFTLYETRIFSIHALDLIREIFLLVKGFVISFILPGFFGLSRGLIESFSL
jgi:hypothetical protein